MLNPKQSEITNRNTNYVFLFGDMMSGKTLLLATVLLAMENSTTGYFKFRKDLSGEYAEEFYSKIKGLIESQRIGHRNGIGSVIELDISFTIKKQFPLINITFIDSGGEDHTFFGQPDSPLYKKLPEDLNIYFDTMSIELTTLLMVGFNDANRRDLMMYNFLEFLSRKPHLYPLKILLIITKWDKYTGYYVDDVSRFVESEMPKTFSKINQLGGDIKNFSIGEVDDKEFRLLSLNLNKAKNIKDWLYKTIATGKKTMDENNSEIFLTEIKNEFFAKKVKQIQNLVSKNEITTALSLLLESKDFINEDLYIQILQLSQRWEKLEKEKFLSIISSNDAELRNNQLVYNLSIILSKLKKS